MFQFNITLENIDKDLALTLLQNLRFVTELKEVEADKTKEIMAKTFKNFEEWETDDLEQVFGLQESQNHSKLEEWLEVKPEFSTTEKERLAYFHNLLKEEVRDWNEEELKIQFIAHILDMAQYREANLKTFFERKIYLDLTEIKMQKALDITEVSGKVDCLIAQKSKKPHTPYFCLHEYKKENSQSQDPLGQLLIAMFAAQQLNENIQTIYGSYVVGRQWFFVILEGKEYSVSREYLATRLEETEEILAILQKMKNLIHR